MTNDEIESLARQLAELSTAERTLVVRRLRSILIVGARLSGRRRRPNLRREIGTVLYDGSGIPVAVLKKWTMHIVRDPRELRPWQLGGDEQYEMLCDEITNEEFINEIQRREIGRVKDR